MDAMELLAKKGAVIPEDDEAELAEDCPIEETVGLSH